MGLKDQRKKSLEEALEANAEYYGFDFSEIIELGGEEFEIRYREFLDAPTRRRVDDVYRKFNDCDREEITVNRKTIQGGFKEPRTYNGERFDLDEEVGKALWGAEKYDRWIKAGGPPGLIQIIWNRMRHQFTRRLMEDSKSS